VVAVAGNVGLELTVRNSLRVLDWLGATDVPVYAGADRPLSGVVREASHWHGPDGLGGARLPDSTRSPNEDGVGYLCDAIMRQPGQVTLVCTAPLTNLALAVRREPDLVQSVKEVVLMGGAARLPGNVTPVAEFNIYADPDAAAGVFEAAWPITMVGLDVTERVRLERAERQPLEHHTTREGQLVFEVTRHIFDVNGYDTMALHDPLALAIAVQPDLVTTVQRDVRVEARGEHTLGQTIVDYRRSAPPSVLNTRVCTEVDVGRARAWFVTTLGL
jgi:inosine-uridine nucleoside N-ribohydrolase